MALNFITAGDYRGSQIFNPLGLGRISVGGKDINKLTVASIDLINQNTFKTKNTIAINWSDGKRSMAEVDAHTYKQLLRICFWL